MSKLFIAVLNMSLAASWVTLIVILLRLLLKKLPKRYSYVLWFVVLVRLCIPFSFESTFSLLAVRPQAIPPDIALAASPSVESGLNLLDTAVNSAIGALPPPVPQASVNPLQIVIEAGAIVWLAGAALLLGYAAISFVRLKLRLSAAVRTGEQVFESDRITSPFVLGFFRPKIYLPLGLSGLEREYILHHEHAHLRRGDHIFKTIWYIALCCYWFNPLAWVSFFLMGRDMEMSCDEQVLRKSDEDARRLYSASLLSLSIKRSGLLVPLAFGEHSIKTRIKNVLTYKKPMFWLSVATVIIIAAAAVCLLTNPATERITSGGFEAVTLRLEPGNGITPEAKPFILSVDLPAGWTTKALPRGEGGRFAHGLESPVDIYDADGNSVGTIACSGFVLYPDAGDNPRGVYNQIMLAAHYNWGFEYTPIAKTDKTCTATTLVGYSRSYLDNSPGMPIPALEHEGMLCNKGILAYDNDLLSYTAIELRDTAVTDEQLLAIAKSVKLSPADADSPTATTVTDGFAIEKALEDARFFIVPPSTGEPTFEADLMMVGSAALQSYYAYFARPDVPEEYRILSFEPHGIALLAGTPEEFAVAMDFDYKTSGRYFMSANGSVVPTADGGLEVTRAYIELRIKHLSGNTSYQIIDMGTGGAGQGLPPVNEWLYRRELADMNAKRPEILSVLRAQFEAYSAGTVTNNLLEPRFDTMPDDALIPSLNTVDDFTLVAGNDMSHVYAVVDFGKYEAYCGIVTLETADGSRGEYVTSVSFQAKAPSPDYGPAYPTAPSTPLVMTIGPGSIGCSFAVLDGNLGNHEYLRSTVTGFTPLVLYPGDNPAITERARIFAENATINGKQPTSIELWYYPGSGSEAQAVAIEPYRLDADRLEGEGTLPHTFALPNLPGDYLCRALLSFDNRLQQTVVFAVRVVGIGQSYDGISGEKLSNDDLNARITSNGDSTFRAGTKAELEECLAKLANASNQTISKLLISIHYTETTRDLTPDEIALVLDTLKASNLSVFESLPNSAIGGGIFIAAYDIQGGLQWSVSFDGDQWFAVSDGTQSLVFRGDAVYLQGLASALEP